MQRFIGNSPRDTTTSFVHKMHEQNMVHAIAKINKLANEKQVTKNIIVYDMKMRIYYVIWKIMKRHID